MSAVATMPSTRGVAEAAKRASRTLATMSEASRNAALEAMAKALEAASEEIFTANLKDVRAAEEGVDRVSAATMARLRMDGVKLGEMVEQVRSVAALSDPLGRTLDADGAG